MKCEEYIYSTATSMCCFFFATSWLVITQRKIGAVSFSPRLTWRDVQHVIVESSQVTSPLDEGWKTNGAGKRYNHKFGFGRLDVSKMVNKALTWKNVEKQRICHGAEHSKKRFVKEN